MSRRDLKDVSARGRRPRNAGASRHSGRFPGLEPPHLRIWPQYLSLQGLRFDCNAAVPLAVQLLPQPRVESNERLDGRNLRALDRRSRRARSLARVLVPKSKSLEVD